MHNKCHFLKNAIYFETHNLQLREKQIIQTDPQATQISKLTGKDFKIILLNVSKKIEKMMGKISEKWKFLIQNCNL